MIVQDTIEKYISYAQELIRRIKSRQKIDSSQLVIYKSGNASGWDIYFSSSDGEYKREFWRVSFIPTHGGTPYTEFDVYATGDTNAWYRTYDDNATYTDRVTIVIFIDTRYAGGTLSLRVNARSLDTGTLTFQKI